MVQSHEVLANSVLHDLWASGIVSLSINIPSLTAGCPTANFTVQEHDTLNLAIVNSVVILEFLSTMNMFFDDMQ